MCGRAETAARIADLEVVPRRQVPYRDVTIEEMDLDAVLRRRPDIVVVDELPHSNAPGSKNEKRWQDVEGLLGAGISVLTALNVQHLEGVQDIVRSATGIDIRERVPDRIVREGDSVVLRDLPVAELQERLKQGNIYPPEQARARARELLPHRAPGAPARAGPAADRDVLRPRRDRGHARVRGRRRRAARLRAIRGDHRPCRRPPHAPRRSRPPHARQVQKLLERGRGVDVVIVDV